MRAIHACAAVFQLAAVAFFAWVYSFTGDGLYVGFAGWCAFWGAWSLTALRRRRGIRA